MKRQIMVNEAVYFILEDGAVSTNWKDVSSDDYSDMRTMSWIEENVEVDDLLFVDSPSDFLLLCLDNAGYTLGERNASMGSF